MNNHRIKVFKAMGENRLTAIVNEWMESNKYCKVIDIKFSVTSNILQNGREVHTFCALVHYYDSYIFGRTANEFVLDELHDIETR